MWLFLPGGLLMPSVVPEGKGDPAFTNNGLWMMQVRARAKSHLENFIRDYMEEGTYSEIQATPSMDYNYRFYTTHEQLALATAKAILDIDYAKFKPTAERTDKDGNLLYEDGKEYHTVLNSIWSTVCRLGSPGGHYGAYTSSNPNGYKNAQDYYKYYERPDKSKKGYSRAWWEDDYTDDFDHTTGRSFLDHEVSAEELEAWEQEGENLDAIMVAEAVIDIMKDSGLDVGQWFPFMTHAEDRALRSYAERCLTLKKSDLEPIEVELVEHYYGSDWENLPKELVSLGSGEPPFEEMDSNVQFEKVPQKPAQRRKQNRRRNGKRQSGKARRGVQFN